MRRPKKYRRRRIPWFVILLGIFVAVIVGGIAFYENQQAGYNFPFPCLSEVANYHVHPYLRIVIDGQNITIPAAIGIVNPQYQNGIARGGTCFEPLHTHDATGIIHVESAGNTNYTLSEFFQIWNDTYHSITLGGVNHPVVFSNTDILGFRADSTHRIVLLVDGQPSSEYQSLVLSKLDYCSSAGQSIPPCYPTAGGDPAYGGIAYPYGTGHTIVIEYLSTS
ncbi:MAG: hypothetical protein E6K95_02750 [Thaumarchaeota archaeon]|nr:MAG: hypothetical protein E6K95_02750 [Nitrososphaerota archaeon]TLY17621.1 MAG: hypothetical protein E6K86_01335 [Nitrososphaerota archaeon]TMP96286.1 MAG: hypothetical protein E6K99_10245 [Nitrososphaerota archaeon]